ncbi:hypothetical protein OE766_14275 [Pararhizobium sp. YC-54]|uniref:hypothetical protein n=1 Tax=Pararhizobium sp. YC-54 TaxID=2986920 RepID=UPI0021F75D95|nr:hypothetical protein [Pararhizobium sp. YC-54]MCV9999412.1 hypothetical protein [Pararhizobium sp. YC-54]
MDLVQAGSMPVYLYIDDMKAILLEAAKVIRQIETAMAAKNSEGREKRQRRSAGDAPGLTHLCLV